MAFSEVSVVSDFENGVIDTVQANGIGSLNSNTVMFGWSRKKERLESHLRIDLCSRLHIIVSEDILIRPKRLIVD